MTKYYGVFSGRTKDGERIFLYRDNLGPDLYIKRGEDGPLQALSPNATITHYTDRVNESVHIEIISPEWTGKAVANHFDLVVEEGFNLPAAAEGHIVRGEE